MLGKRTILSVVFVTAVIACSASAANIKGAADRCGNWLIEQYDIGDKTFGKGKDRKDVMTVALIVSALNAHPHDYKEVSGPFSSEPVKFLLSKIKKDGSLKDIKDKECECECLSQVIYALESTENEAHKEAIESCKSYLNAHFKECVANADKDAVWTKQDQLTSVTLAHDSLMTAFQNAKAALKAGKKEIQIEGKATPWAATLAEAVIKLQNPNGSFGTDLQTNALALNILNICYKGVKLQ